MSALILLPFWLGDDMGDPYEHAARMRDRAMASANLELDYAGVSDEDRAELSDLFQVLPAVVIPL